MKKLLIPFVLLFALLAACGSAAETAAPTAQPQATQAPAATEVPENEPVSEISIDAADYSYEAVEAVSNGWVRVNLTNSGTEVHHVQFLRMNDGVTFEQFQEALQQGEGPALALVKHMGGIGAIAPTGSAQAVLDLPAGNYVILCFVASADHAPHFAKGMIKTLEVMADSASPLAEPEGELTITLKDFAIDMPETIPAGESVIKVVNEGPEPHEFNLLLLAEGKSVADVLAFLQAPSGQPPFLPVGGLNGFEPGGFGYLEQDLKPGKYVAICNIPSPVNEGHQHFSLGMVKEFSVTESAADLSGGTAGW
jgi:uncharacterized cupredoxin-like copper-binding protein